MTTLEGPTWHLVRGVAIPDGTTISARFVGGTVSGSGGVNRYRADYRLDGDRLGIGPAAATRMAGSDAANRAEQAMFGLLERVRSARVDAAGLALLDDDGQELLGFEAAPAVGDALAGRWAVRSVRRGEAMVPASADAAPTLEVTADGRVSGNVGIDRIDGPARLDGDRLHLGPLRTTRMVGDQERMEEGAGLVEALESAAAIREDGDQLVLLDVDGEPIVVLTRADRG